MSTMASVPASPERTRLFTVDEVLRMVEVGIIDPGEHVELLDGEIVVVSPHGEAHCYSIQRLNARLAIAYHPAHQVRVQLPLYADERSLPEPDLAVVSSDLDILSRHPRCDQALLVVEVAVTSGWMDRRKGRIYGRSGAPVYWLVDVPRRAVVVREGPGPDGYARERVVGLEDELTLPGIDVAIPVRDVLPPPD